MRFPAGNDIPYGQDFGFFRGIPSDVEWKEAKLLGTLVKLVATGYGKPGDYGNGAIFVHWAELGKAVKEDAI